MGNGHENLEGWWEEGEGETNWEIRTDMYTFSSVQSLSRVRLFATPWTTVRQAPLSITNSRSLPKLMSIESVMPSNHLILCRPLLLLPSVFPSIRVFSNESVLRIRWPKYKHTLGCVKQIASGNLLQAGGAQLGAL